MIPARQAFWLLNCGFTKACLRRKTFISALCDEASRNACRCRAYETALRLRCQSETGAREATMGIRSTGIGWLTLALVVQQAQAKVTVQRCAHEQGVPTFTQGACPGGQPGQPYRAWNAPPGSVLPPQPTTRAKPHKPSQPAITPARPEPQVRATKHATTPKARKRKPAKYTPWKSVKR